MDNNEDENETKNQENQNKTDNFNISVKRISEKRRHNLFSFIEIIDDNAKRRLTRRIKKLSTIRHSSNQKSNFVLNLEQIQERINNLQNLFPFFPEFDDFMENEGEKIMGEIAVESYEDIIEKDKIIYKYGDEIKQFYLILDGKVDLFFPFTEEVEMNIDEFYIYMLRLRRYNEIEMLNDVLLLNDMSFMKEIGMNFNIDKYIYKLYLTYLRIEIDPEFLIKEESKDKKKDLYTKDNIFDFIRKNKINFEDTFDDKEIKELVLRISEELIETIKWIMPEKLCDIIVEKKDEGIYKRIVNIKDIFLKQLKSNCKWQNVESKNYAQRIMPKKVINDRLISKKMIIMKYLYIDTLKKGQHFGEFTPDSFALFSHSYLAKIKKSDFRHVELHKYHNFRNMTVIASSLVHFYSFNKSIFSNYFLKFIEKKTLKKKQYLSNHHLFSKSNNNNLLKTYSLCFKEKELKEGDNIIKENESLTESNINIYFILEGECQLSCHKTIPQIDEIIKILGKEHLIKETYNQEVKNILNTPQYDSLVKNPVQIKLNFLKQNDIVGLTECFEEDKYFINVKCSQRGTKLLYVDSRIIKMFIDSDETIKENKDKIVYEKYRLLSQNLINQRKMFFDSILNMNKIRLEIDTGYRPLKIKYKSLPQIRTYKSIKMKNSKFNDLLNAKSTMNNFNMNTKLKHFDGDLDKILISINYRNVLNERRMEKSKELRKKLKEKMEKKLKDNEQKIKRKRLNVLKLFDTEKENKYFNPVVFESKLGAFSKTNLLNKNIYKILPSLKTNSLKELDNKYELVIPYQYHKLKSSSSTSQINPLFYDDFNRSFNLSQYFNLNTDDKNKSYETKQSSLDYTLKIKGINDNTNTNKNRKTLYKNNTRINNRLNKGYFRINITKVGKKKFH